MSEDTKSTSADHVTRYLQGVLEDRMGVVHTRDGDPLQPRGAGHIAPSFWADAPWRLEPDEDEIHVIDPKTCCLFLTSLSAVPSIC